MGKIEDLIGKVYHCLTVISFYELCPKRGRVWVCKCQCGKLTKVPTRRLNNGNTKSCGCLKLDSKCGTHRETHKTKEWSTWNSMKERCLCVTSKKYPVYGGRGIKVCNRWLNSYENFLSDMGRAPSKSHSIDRIDVNGHYETSNCRWATSKQQARNKQNTRLIPYRGESKILKDWCAELGLSYGRVYHRIVVLKWDAEMAFNRPKLRM